MSAQQRAPKQHSGRARSRAGWADDIVAPRQEIDTLSLLHAEAAIQEALDGLEKVTSINFIEEYVKARNAYRHDTEAFVKHYIREPDAYSSETFEPTRKRLAAITQKVALFGARASARARRQVRAHSVLICSSADRQGILAGLAETIADEGANIAGAFMSLVSGHLVTAFLLSGSSIDAAAVQLRLPHLRIDCMPISSDSVDWPLPGSSCWHANARLRGDTHLLLELTRVISERQLPIVALSSWLESDAEQRADPATHGTTGAEDRVEVVDLNFAVAPEPGGDDHHIVDELEAEIRQILPDAQLDIKLVTWPTRYRAQKNIVPTHASDVVVTVVGHARPGFVRSVLLGLTRAATRVDDAIVELCGSSMAILDGVSVFTMVFKRVRNVELQNLDRQIRNALSLQLRQRHQHMPIGVQVVEATAGWQDETEQRETTSSNRPDWPTHELTIRVADQPRVIAKVARLLASLKVNITWFVSHVLEPVIGERAATYAIKMHLSVPSESLDEVSASLRSLKEAEGWKEVSMREWSLAQ